MTIAYDLFSRGVKSLYLDNTSEKENPANSSNAKPESEIEPQKPTDRCKKLDNFADTHKDPYHTWTSGKGKNPYR
jgi:hypothetical protein